LIGFVVLEIPLVPPLEKGEDKVSLFIKEGLVVIFSKTRLSQIPPLKGGVLIFIFTAKTLSTLRNCFIF
jgi:hypothetical protein